MHLAPHVKIHVDEELDPLALAKVAEIAVRMGMPVDGAALARTLGLPLLQPGALNPVRLAPVSPTDIDRLQTEFLPPKRAS